MVSYLQVTIAVPNQYVGSEMDVSRKVLALVVALIPGASNACSCLVSGVHQDSIDNANNLFFAKVISAKANEEQIEDRLITTSVTFEYRVEYVIRGKHHVGEIVKEVTYPYSSACSRVPNLRVSRYFLSSGPIGNICGLLVSPLARISNVEREIIKNTDGGPDAVEWLEKLI